MYFSSILGFALSLQVSFLKQYLDSWPPVVCLHCSPGWLSCNVGAMYCSGRPRAEALPQLQRRILHRTTHSSLLAALTRVSKLNCCGESITVRCINVVSYWIMAAILLLPKDAGFVRKNLKVVMATDQSPPSLGDQRTSHPSLDLEPLKSPC